MVRRLVDVMAHDLGVPRRASDDPDGEALACRCTFTALRFWMQAYCIDDGSGGAAGIAQTAVEQKSLAWIKQMSALYPQLRSKFTPALIHQYCSALTAIGDLAETSEGMLRCTKPHDLRIPYSGGTFVIAQLGLRDLTVQDWEGCVLSDAVVFAGVSKHNGIVGFDPDMIGWELPYRDELLFLAKWQEASNALR